MTSSGMPFSIKVQPNNIPIGECYTNRSTNIGKRICTHAHRATLNFELKLVYCVLSSMLPQNKVNKCKNVWRCRDSRTAKGKKPGRGIGIKQFSVQHLSHCKVTEGVSGQ